MNTETKTYDVLFVARTENENKPAGMIAENVDKATAIRHAQKYCHRNEDNEGVMIAYHQTRTARRHTGLFVSGPFRAGAQARAAASATAGMLSMSRVVTFSAFRLKTSDTSSQLTGASSSFQQS